MRADRQDPKRSSARVVVVAFVIVLLVLLGALVLIEQGWIFP